ncbi:MAG TPA: hypothetical protein PK997_05260 [Candidatus Omnitrophota bacterium]|nr:MAG: hypothetical protein BWY49_00642 [Candidatus Omnitrophica bacterium ADurb.Bin314]HOE69053.1 hypothetical protein [Candidatus Omnitrophota bacterium]HQB94604.1 hypothetical protein [Candidatus Omnitrophota bacterium]
MMESLKNVIVAGVIALALIICALIIKSGIENARRMSPPEAFTLYGYEGVLYRLNNVSGRLDALVPSNEAAVLLPVLQVQLPRPDVKLSDEEKTSLTANIKTLAQYIQGERNRSLGIGNEPQSSKSPKQS